MKITEGYMPYLGHKTWYRVAGETAGSRKPILLLHGGPGSTHNSLELLDPLAEDGRMVITYDQIGCGNSYLEGHPELWTLETWKNELIALIDHLGLGEFHLLGQSWGGMLTIAYVSDCGGDRVKSAVLSSTLPSSQLWGREQHRNIRFMSEEDQAAIAEAERTGVFTGEAYEKAVAVFMERHCYSPPKATDPECIRREKKAGSESYLYGWGPNEFSPMGTLKNFDYTDKLKSWKTPALVISGTDDLCTPLIAKTMYDAIPDARWELFAGCRHTVYAEENEKYLALVREWLAAHD